jgi:hypothetical protein
MDALYSTVTPAPSPDKMGRQPRYYVLPQTPPLPSLASSNPAHELRLLDISFLFYRHFIISFWRSQFRWCDLNETVGLCQFSS